ncbi:MAG: FIST C-terminal domain-containing protein [Betaproteobacteria bacterium]|nr:FIST C-terminal domain-containing protein [Betaproteobacteria bacterium]
MERFISAHAGGSNWLSAASRCLEQLRSLPPSANLGFLYVSDELAGELPNIVHYFRDSTNIPHWVGSVGLGICGVSQEYHEEPAISVMAGAFPEGSFRVFGTVDDDLKPFLREHRDWIRDTQSRFGIVHADPRNQKVPELICDLAAAANDGFLVGGITSSRGAYAQVAEEVTEGGVSGVLFSPEVAVATNLTQSCAPFGKMYEITECRENIIMTLSHKPALDVFFEEIGDVLARDLNRAARYVGAALPVRGSDTGDYLVRNVVGIDPRNRLLAIGEHLETGQLIQFCRRDPANAMKDLQRMLRDLKGRVPGQPRGSVYYSCVGRGKHMFGEHSEELKTIREELGDVPLTGFFCNGEISFNRLYGYTGVLAVFL